MLQVLVSHFLKISDLMKVTLRGDDVQGFDAKWDGVLLESLCRMQLKDSEQLKTTFDLYSQEIVTSKLHTLEEHGQQVLGSSRKRSTL